MTTNLGLFRHLFSSSTTPAQPEPLIHHRLPSGAAPVSQEAAGRPAAAAAAVVPPAPPFLPEEPPPLSSREGALMRKIASLESRLRSSRSSLSVALEYLEAIDGVLVGAIGGNGIVDYVVNEAGERTGGSSFHEVSLEPGLQFDAARLAADLAIPPPEVAPPQQGEQLPGTVEGAPAAKQPATSAPSATFVDGAASAVSAAFLSLSAHGSRLLSGGAQFLSTNPASSSAAGAAATAAASSPVGDSTIASAAPPLPRRASSASAGEAAPAAAASSDDETTADLQASSMSSMAAQLARYRFELGSAASEGARLSSALDAATATRERAEAERDAAVAALARLDAERLHEREREGRALAAERELAEAAKGEAAAAAADAAALASKLSAALTEAAAAKAAAESAAADKSAAEARAAQLLAEKLASAAAAAEARSAAPAPPVTAASVSLAAAEPAVATPPPKLAPVPALAPPPAAQQQRQPVSSSSTPVQQPRQSEHQQQLHATPPFMYLRAVVYHYLVLSVEGSAVAARQSVAQALASLFAFSESECKKVGVRKVSGPSLSAASFGPAVVDAGAAALPAGGTPLRASPLQPQQASFAAAVSMDRGPPPPTTTPGDGAGGGGGVGPIGKPRRIDKFDALE